MSGGLIQTACGSGPGADIPLTKRSGCAWLDCRGEGYGTLLNPIPTWRNWSSSVIMFWISSSFIMTIALKSVNEILGLSWCFFLNFHVSLRRKEWMLSYQIAKIDTYQMWIPAYAGRTLLLSFPWKREPTVRCIFYHKWVSSWTMPDSIS